VSLSSAFSLHSYTNLVLFTDLLSPETNPDPPRSWPVRCENAGESMANWLRWVVRTLANGLSGGVRWCQERMAARERSESDRGRGQGRR